ncbi:hypothetical protein SDC9_63599 [bioreactor metagenome]|uniref:Uncharacterized protein n=1 Tax=bioreactor metagenome TaxID=1076179 RepID=A0A644XN34_9ZZZZ
MSGKQNGFFSTDFFDQITDFDNLIRIKTTGRFIHNQNLGIVYQCLSQSDTLLVAFRKRPDAFVHFRCKSGDFNHFVHPRFLVLQVVNACNECQEFPHIHVVIQRIVLRQVANNAPYGQTVIGAAQFIHKCFSARRRNIAGEDFHQCGLTCPVWSKQPDNFTFVDFKRNSVQRLLLSVHLCYLIDPD